MHVPYPYARPTRTPKGPSGPTPPYRPDDFTSRADYERQRYRDGILDGPVSPLAPPEVAAVVGVRPLGRPAAMRSSSYLTTRDFLRLHRAVAFANLRGLKLNMFATFSWEALGVTHPQAVIRCREAIFERLNKRAAERGVDHPAIWVDEVGDFLGHHTHALLHCNFMYERELKDWISSAVRHQTGEDAFAKREGQRGPIVPVRVSNLYADPHFKGQWAKFKYMMKGIHPGSLITAPFHHRSRFLLSEVAELTRVSRQGTIIGKRCGYSHSLGRKREADFVTAAHLDPDDDWYASQLRWRQPDIWLNPRPETAAGIVSLYGSHFYSCGKDLRTRADCIAAIRAFQDRSDP